MKTAELYDQDFAEWARTNAELLRARRFSEVDLEHVAEEIEDLAKRDRRSLYNRFVRLMEHLLKWQFQPQRRTGSWRRTIIEQRSRIEQLLAENPSFRRSLPQICPEAYKEAVKFVSTLTGRTPKEFPQTCPFSLEELLDETFLPESEA